MMEDGIPMDFVLALLGDEYLKRRYLEAHLSEIAPQVVEQTPEDEDEGTGTQTDVGERR